MNKTQILYIGLGILNIVASLGSYNDLYPASWSHGVAIASFLAAALLKEFKDAPKALEAPATKDAA